MTRGNYGDMKWTNRRKAPPNMKTTDEPTPSATDACAIADEQFEQWFTYHPPRPGQHMRYVFLRRAGHTLARVIRELTPPGPDQSAAIRKVREAVMTANAAIACESEAQTAKYATAQGASEGPE